MMIVNYSNTLRVSEALRDKGLAREEGVGYA